MATRFDAIGAGQLRHQVTIEENTDTTQDSYGALDDETWKPITDGVVWASIKPLMGRELWNAQQVQADVTHRVIIRTLSTVEPKMSVKFGTRRFGIVSVLDMDEIGVYSQLLCKELLS